MEGLEKTYIIILYLSRSCPSHVPLLFMEGLEKTYIIILYLSRSCPSTVPLLFKEGLGVVFKLKFKKDDEKIFGAYKTHDDK
jgi:hypothetical protein